MKLRGYIICGILIALGLFSTISLIKIFNVKGGEFGNIVIWEQMADYDEFSKFDDVIDFETTDFLYYKSVKTAAPQRFDGTEEKYAMLFNDRPVDNVMLYAGKITGSLTLNFRNVSGQIVSTSNVSFKVEYLTNMTRVTIETSNQNNSISYLMDYIAQNGAVLRVVKGGIK